VAACTFVVVGMWLLSRWIVRLLAAPEFFESYEAVGLVATGVMLYALYFVLIVVLGRTGRTEYNFPATAAGAIANVALNLALVPSLGIVGAGIALVASYIVLLALLLLFSQRLFPVPYEWRRLAHALALAAALVAAGELLLPTEGAIGFLSRSAVWLSYPPLLWATGFPQRWEREGIAKLLDPRTVRQRLRALREQALRASDAPPAAEPPASLEAELRDEDARP
jgi:O-antigen/teichoic acid export membrane protein